MRYLSVASGIEAASVAWHPLGWHPVGFAEIESYPCSVLREHWPDVPNFGDITQFKEWPDATFDVLVGGTPCQGFSVAGLRGGMADPRSQLAYSFAGIAARYRPTWLLWENVPGTLSSGDGRDIAGFIRGLVELGYRCAWRILDAQFFGVPQRRRRLFIVGHLGDWRRAAAVLFERESLRGDSAPRREKGKDVAGTITSSAAKRGGVQDSNGDGGLITSVVGTLSTNNGTNRQAVNAVAFGGNNQSGSIDVATAVNAHGGPHGRIYFESETFITVNHSLCGEGYDASEDGTGRGTPLVSVAQPLSTTTGGISRDEPGASIVAFAYNQRNEVRELSVAVTQLSIRRGDAKSETLIAFTCKDHGADAGDQAPTLRSMNEEGGNTNGGGQVAVAVAFDARQSDVIEYGEKTGPLDTDGHSMGIHQAMHVRRLTPTECERLQGFPDDYTAITIKGKPAADGPRYKALGNSMAVPVMRWLGERIERVHAMKAECH